MSHPVLWCPKPFFYAIGNTPPGCFTKDLAPEEPANILLLGCGDPRSILYTVYGQLGRAGRALDFTCCDVEPAILARNAILLTLIADGVPAVQCWRIFYHFFLDNDAQATLRRHCQQLIEVSSTLEKWNSSKYGRFVRFCTQQSLFEISRHWGLYLETTNLQAAEEASLRNEFSANMKTNRARFPPESITLSSMRSAAPVIIPSATDSFKVGHAVFEMYWSKGTLESSTLGKPSSPHPNPLFAFSLAGRVFYPHYASNPVVGFSLARLFATTATLTIESLLENVLEQFTSWCTAFKRRVDSPSMSTAIRLFAGDCLTFCQSLHIARTRRIHRAGLQASPFGVTQIRLSEPDYSLESPKAPLLFNVIETSNLIDHLGLISLLVVTIPILERVPWAAIHTNSLIRSSLTGPPVSALNDRAFADVPTLSILLGISPAAYLTPFTSHSDKQETMLSLIGGNLQYHESIVWKYPSTIVAESRTQHPELEEKSAILKCDATQLARFFFSVYLEMFLEENIAATLTPPYRALKRINLVHYTRASFAEFLAFIKTRVSVEWEKAMELLLFFIRQDRSLGVGLNNYQDLLCQMFLRGIYDMPFLRWDHMEKVRSQCSLFDGWKAVPPVVCIVLVVPRHTMRPLEVMDREQILTPVIYCELRGSTGFNMQTSIRPSFGRVSLSGTYDERRVTIEEDLGSWQSDSDLIISFDVQSWILTQGMTDVDFNIRITPSNRQALLHKLHNGSTVYTASLADSQHVYVLRYRPNNFQDICAPDDQSSVAVGQDSGLHPEVSVVFDESSKIATMIRREDVREEVAKGRLSNGTPVHIGLLADNALVASFNGYQQLFTYPFPVRGNQRKARIARKSSYIELEVPIRPHFEDSRELSLNYFPMARSPKSFSLVNMHYINLDVLPSLPNLPRKRFKWLDTHLGLMFSDSERVNHQLGLDRMGMLVNLKESIAHCFMHSTGFKDGVIKSSMTSLAEEDMGVYCTIFFNGVKIDVTENTVVLDACVVPATFENVFTTAPVITSLMNGKSSIRTQADEMRTWKTFLPALAERCRTWNHTPNCEYRTVGIPASGPWIGVEGNMSSPLCSCGKGKNLGRFDTVPEWQSLRSEATRIAIGPLFSFSFLEETLANLSNGSSPGQTPAAGSASRKANCCVSCGKEGRPKLLVCSNCKTTKYCSVDCQKLHWKDHKKQCKK